MAGRYQYLVTACLIALLVAFWATDRALLRAKHQMPAIKPLSAPQHIGEWFGTPLPLAKGDAIIPYTRMRIYRYQRAGEPTAQTMELVTVAAGDATAFHNPSFCYQGAGWALVSKERQTLPHTALMVERLILQRGDYRLLVFYWYATRDASGKLGQLQAGRLRMLLEGLSPKSRQPAVFFRTSTLINGNEAQAQKRSSEFLGALLSSYHVAR